MSEEIQDIIPEAPVAEPAQQESYLSKASGLKKKDYVAYALGLFIGIAAIALDDGVSDMVIFDIGIIV